MAEIKMMLDKKFSPIYLFEKQFNERLKTLTPAKCEFSLLRDGCFCETQRIDVLPEGVDDALNYKYVERKIKSALWIYGGHKILLKCNRTLFEQISTAYAEGGARSFDADFFSDVYGVPFTVEYAHEIPDAVPEYISASKRGDGARIGFDAGGSDMKVAAVLDGKVVYSREIVWHPKLNSNPQYHVEQISNTIMRAARELPRVDGIGVSSAGIYVNNETRVASLFLKVPKNEFSRIRTIYVDIAKKLNVPVTVANDGDVAALAGAVELNKSNLLGIAMGTSEAAGFVDADGNLRGWLNELAFVPVDVCNEAAVDEWSGDVGTGVKYLSQDGVIKLAEIANISFVGAETPAEKLKVVQNLVEEGDSRAKEVFCDVGTYLAYALLYYHGFYGFDNVLLMGRVVSGIGGEIIKTKAEEVLSEYEREGKIELLLPDEKSRRVGQAVAAAAL